MSPNALSVTAIIRTIRSTGCMSIRDTLCAISAQITNSWPTFRPGYLRLRGRGTELRIIFHVMYSGAVVHRRRGGKAISNFSFLRSSTSLILWRTEKEKASPATWQNRYEFHTPVLEQSRQSPNEIDHMNRFDDECFASTYAYQTKVPNQICKHKNEHSSKTLSPSSNTRRIERN